jgi:hypothetical protein
MLDPVSPALFDPMFERTFDTFEASGSLLDFRRLGDHVLIALDGTEYFCSQKLSCPNCSHRKRSNGTVENFHSFVAATLLAPGLKHALPLQPEFVVPQDGHDKQDCENRAAHRWFAKHGERYRHLKPIYLGDDLYAHQPICEAVKAAGGNFIFVCKPSSHKIVGEYLTGVQLSELTIKHKDHRGKRVTHHFRWLGKVPLREGADAMKVDWFDFEIRDANGKTTYYNSFITDLTVEASNVAELASCGRTRWKIENEAFNVLKTKGYNLEHNFGHGKQNLAALLAVLNLLAFAFHTVCDLSDALWKRARRGRTRNEFFSKLDFLTSLMLIQSWHQLLTIMVEGLPPPAPA